MQVQRILMCIFIIMGITTGPVFAQSKSTAGKTTASKKKQPAKTEDEKGIITIFFPEFLHITEMKKGDTSFNYEYFDKNSFKVNFYELKDIDAIDHADYFKEYPGGFSGNAAISAPVAAILVYKYVHPAHALWVRYDLNTGEIIHYQIPEKMTIVATDSTTLTNPTTKEQRKFIYKYLKTEITSRHIPHVHEH